jgi:hypothetical protein
MSQTLPIKFEPIVEKLIKCYEALPPERLKEVNQVLIPVFQSFEALADNLPDLIKKTTNAHVAMTKFPEIKTDEDREAAMELLGKIKNSYEVNSKRRKLITEAPDAFKDYLMQFENQVDYTGKKKNEYTRIKSDITRYDQLKLEENKRQEAEAARRKEIENHKVDVKLQIEKNIVALIGSYVAKTDAAGKEFFDKITLETWDAQILKFKGWKPKIKVEDFDKCFEVTFNGDLLTIEDMLELKHDCKMDNPYEEKNAAMQERAKPFIDAWIAKIPEIRAEKEALLKAASEEEKAKLEREQKEKAELEQRRRENILRLQQEQENKANEQKAQISKISNEFQEQGTVQQLESVGPTKKILRFNSEKEFARAFAEIVHHCILRPKFPGIYKLDAKKEKVLDAQGRPEYRDEIKWWTNFFMSNCDAKITGTTIEEDVKTIVRK